MDDILEIQLNKLSRIGQRISSKTLYQPAKLQGGPTNKDKKEIGYSLLIFW